MVYSMTGYGEASRELDGRTFRMEIKSLNGKSTDIRFRSALNLRDKELSLRKMVTDMGVRGKFDVNLVLTAGASEDNQLNLSVMDTYYKDLIKFSELNKLPTGDILQTLIRLPNVVQLAEDAINDDEWQIIEAITKDAMTKLNDFRRTEGQSIAADLKERVTNIMSALGEMDTYDQARVDNIKERIRKNLNQHFADESIDENRFEQEIIFYLEKLDVNEEKVRLTQHCDFFLKELLTDQMGKGRKLNFISQEMGREINTLGAKAQQSDMQKLVVRMKDELEKVKEQVLNTL